VLKVKVYAYGKMIDSRPVPNNRQIFSEELKSLKGDILIEVSENRGTRSNQQNKYYWSVVCGLISEHTGYTPEEVHNFYKELFLTDKKEVIIGKDKLVIEQATTTKLTTKEFEEYCENIRRHASTELSVSIPEPNE
jgi:hypothetical protein